MKSEGGWAVGDGLTAVDPFLFVYFRWGNIYMKLDMRKEYPKYAKLMDKLGERTAFKETIAAEGGFGCC